VNARVKTAIASTAVALLSLCVAPQARGDPIPIVPSVPGGGLGDALGDALGAIGGGRGGGGGAGAAGAGIGGNETGPGGGGIFTRDFGISNPGAPAIFLCPGVGAAGGAIGGGGGYCDFDFVPVRLSATTEGIGHIHCEWGGFTPLLTVWQCWRVWPGQPDHPKLPDPDIIPDGWGVPWAIAGPSPNDQWPPPGLAPGASFAPPPPDTPPPPPPPPPMFPPWDQPTDGPPPPGAPPPP